MLNKKGRWGILEWGAFASVIAVFILIIIYRAELFSFLIAILSLEPSPSSFDNQLNNQSQQLLFDFSKTTVIGLKPIKQNMYSNSNNIICYGFENPTAEIDENFTLIGEWFTDNFIEPIEPEYEITLNYNKIINQERLNWLFINNSNKIRFRIVLNRGIKPIFKEINYNLINKEELINYLKEDDLISWDDNVIREFINNTHICSKTNDEELAKELMNFVRDYMNPPAKTEDEIYYNNVTLNSMEAWNKKVGTSSEYSVVYAMLARFVGVPSRILFNPDKNKDYYFVEVYLNDTDWIPMDIYNKSKNLKEYFKVEKFEINKNYHSIEIEGFTDLNFISLTPKGISDNWLLINGIVKSNSNETIKSYNIEVNITLLDKDSNSIYSDKRYLLSGKEDLDPGNYSDFEIHLFPEHINDVEFIKILRL